jgi:hypothetical protein
MAAKALHTGSAMAAALNSDAPRADSYATYEDYLDSFIDPDTDLYYLEVSDLRLPLLLVAPNHPSAVVAGRRTRKTTRRAPVQRGW